MSLDGWTLVIVALCSYWQLSLHGEKTRGEFKTGHPVQCALMCFGIYYLLCLIWGYRFV